jgi:hypothetical protein
MGILSSDTKQLKLVECEVVSCKKISRGNSSSLEVLGKLADQPSRSTAAL